MPKLPPVLLLAVLGLAASAAAATEPPPWPQVPRDRIEFDRYARARFADARQLLTGPTPPAAHVPAAGLDCATLYQQRVALTRAQLDHRQPFWDDPRNQAGVFIGALWTPAFYYLPYRAIAEFRERAQAPNVQAELDALRAASAAQRCFER